MFKKYPSIENSYRNKTVEYIRQEFGNEQFVVQEKIHGSNFSIIVDGDIKFASRNGILAENDNFFGYANIKEELLRISSMVDGRYIIYGELFGGAYPHPDVEKYNHSQVQKGIFYSPKLEFFVFDIFDLDKNKYENLLDAEQFCKICNINFVPIRMVGDLDSCLSYTNEFPTMIPYILGLPEIEDNICEGVVIKTSRDCHLSNGDRAILKNKNTKFSEKQKVGKPKVVVELSEEDNNAIAECAELINKNRLDCVLSKLGHPNIKQFGMIVGLLTKDVLDEYGDVSQAAKKEVNKMCAALLRENLDELS